MAVLVITSDRGLAGAYSSTALRSAEQLTTSVATTRTSTTTILAEQASSRTAPSSCSRRPSTLQEAFETTVGDLPVNEAEAKAMAEDEEGQESVKIRRPKPAKKA